jgi:DnaJ-class molecular chaperone
MTYRKFKQAIEVFGLGERATLAQIKARHRQLVKAHHPDQGQGTDPEAIRRVNSAYEALTAYCENYRYCFAEEEFLEQVPEERLRRQFGWDPVWSGQGETEED